MSRMCTLRSVLALAILLLVTLWAVPAYPWHGTGNIAALAIDPVTPTTLYAGTCDRGLFKSTDGGASWTATGLTNISVSALAIDPKMPTTLYAGAVTVDCATGALLPPVEAGVFKSTDGGASWGYIGPYQVVYALAIDPQTPTTLYAGTYWEVFKSTDGGATWSTDGGATWSATGLFSVQTLAIDPVTPTTVYAGTAFASPEGWPGFAWEGGVFKSTDAGATWSATGLVGGDFAVLAIDPRTPTTLYAGGVWANDWYTWVRGLFKSTDGGATWSTSGADPCCGVAIDPRTPTTLYAGDAKGAFKSTDGGATWSAINTGLTDILSAYGVGSAVGTPTIDPLTPNTLYAVTAIGVFKSNDGGAIWSPTGLFQHSPLVSLSLNPTVVTAGTSLTGTVALITAAPAGGVTVALSSKHPSIATVPASVTVPAGATSANFAVSTSSNPNSTAVVITAAFDDATRSALLTLTLMPAVTLSSLSLDPTSVSGGTPSTGTVTLNTAAPADGTAVALFSSNTAVAIVPAIVTVPAGATSANFTVATSPVTASTSVAISGTYSGVTGGAWLTVIPATTLSSMSLNPSSVPAGSPSTGTVALSAAAPAGGAAIALSSSNTSVATVPGSVTVGAGATSANFTVSTSSSCTSSAVTISGTYGGVTRSAGLTATLIADTVTIQQADYYASKHELRVAAKSTGSTATLRVYVTSSGELIGTLRNLGDDKYGGQLSWPVNPQNARVVSSRCGSATSVVRSK